MILFFFKFSGMLQFYLWMFWFFSYSFIFMYLLSPHFSCHVKFISESNLTIFRFNFVINKFHFQLIHIDVIYLHCLVVYYNSGALWCSWDHINKSGLLPEYELPNITEWVTQKFQTSHQFFGEKSRETYVVGTSSCADIKWKWRNIAQVLAT